MINQSTIDNIQNKNTHSTRKPKLIFDPAERRAKLAADIDALCKRHGITDANDINAYVRLGMTYLENQYTTDACLAIVGKSIARSTQECQPTSIERLADRLPEPLAIRAGIRPPKRKNKAFRLLRHSGVILLALLASVAAYELALA